MSNISAPRDNNRVPVMMGTSSVDGVTPVTLYADPTTHRLLTDLTGAGSGSVTNVSVATANGFSGTVANPTSTPAITIIAGAITPTSVNGITLIGSNTPQLSVSGSTSVLGVNTGDQTTITGNAGSATLTAITDDTSTNAVMYPTWVTTASGNQAQKVTSGKLTFNPSTGVLTTTTFSGALNGNASTVTTNANLTGPITSVGNATSIASQTGTGSKIVVDTSPVLITPTLGAATATTINKVTITAPASGATLTIPDGVTLTGPAASGTAMTLGNNETVTGVKTFNDGSIKMNGASSGTSTLKAPAAASTYVHTLPAATTTLDGIDNTATLTNKRITKRVLALSAGSATPAINTDSYDVVHITAQNAAITSFTTNLTGTPVDGDTLRISITDNGTARALTWGTSFEASTVALPTTTVISTRLDVGFFWNTETSKWRCVAVA